MEDPFFVVKEEVKKALNNVTELHEKWKQLVEDSDFTSKEEATFTIGNIRSSIKSIQWDVEDLLDTVNAVEANPLKFELSPSEVGERKLFIKDVKIKLNSIETELADSEVQSKSRESGRSLLLGGLRSNKNKYERLDNEMVESNDRYIQDQYQQQQLLVREQDDMLQQVGRSVSVLKSMGHQIGDELDEQAVILDELNHEMEETGSKLQTVLLRVEKMLKLADDKKQTYVLIGLIVLIIFLLILLVGT